jgi:tetratricopeptide (TPR) repeat protein
LGTFEGEPGYDRSRVLDAASRARSRKRYRKAAALYRRVLAVEPSNLELHARLAPLLAATGQRFDAWLSFQLCARSALADKHLEQAAAIYRDATRCLPREIGAWLKLARVERQRGRKREAFEVLLEGRQQFRSRGRRAEAIALLRKALELERSSVSVALDLTRLLACSDQESEALLLLERLADRSQGVDLRRILGAQWRIAPTVTNSWRWLRAGVSCIAQSDPTETRSLRT